MEDRNTYVITCSYWNINWDAFRRRDYSTSGRVYRTLEVSKNATLKELENAIMTAFALPVEYSLSFMKSLGAYSGTLLSEDSKKKLTFSEAYGFDFSNIRRDLSVEVTLNLELQSGKTIGMRVGEMELECSKVIHRDNPKTVLLESKGGEVYQAEYSNEEVQNRFDDILKLRGIYQEDKELYRSIAEGEKKLDEVK